ncbi:MAG TPA: hypothetical protein VIQ48_02265 [Rhodanobacter sp.]|jgi:hypothetical protein
MNYIELALLVIGAVVLVLGYRKNQRNVLLAGAMLLFLAGTVGDFSSGFIAGITDTSAAPTTTSK